MSEHDESEQDGTRQDHKSTTGAGGADRPATHEPIEIEAESEPQHRVQSFNSTGGFLLIIPVVAATLGLLVAALPLGVLFGMVALPAIPVAEAMARHGRYRGPGHLFACLFSAFSGVAMVEFAAFIAFCTVCLPIAASGPMPNGWPNPMSSSIGMACGSIAGLVVAILLARRFWPKP